MVSVPSCYLRCHRGFLAAVGAVLELASWETSVLPAESDLAGHRVYLQIAR